MRSDVTIVKVILAVQDIFPEHNVTIVKVILAVQDVFPEHNSIHMVLNFISFCMPCQRRRNPRGRLEEKAHRKLVDHCHRVCRSQMQKQCWLLIQTPLSGSLLHHTFAASPEVKYETFSTMPQYRFIESMFIEGIDKLRCIFCKAINTQNAIHPI